MKKFILPFALIMIFIITLPRFFDIYRTMAFNTVPHDDYVPYLLSYAGENTAFTPYSPYGYRILSVLIALPFYKLAPVYQFSNLNNVSLLDLKAKQALAMSSYIAILASCLMIFLIVRKRYQQSMLISSLAACVAYLLFEFTSMVGIDPIAIFMISLLGYFIQQPFLFSGLVLLSVGFNEKIALLFVMKFLSNLTVQRRLFKQPIQLIASILAVGIYGLVRSIVQLPGFEYQTEVNSFFSSIKITLADTFSLKGFVLNIIPVLIILGLYILAVRSTAQKKTPFFSWEDILPALGFLALTFLVRLEYTVGRVMMFCFPLYLPAATLELPVWLRKFEPAPDFP
jgi:hypothetical protein